MESRGSTGAQTDVALEFLVARIVSPELGAAYLGTQGDVWDAQKDMTAAMIGALLCLLLVAVARGRAALTEDSAGEFGAHEVFQTSFAASPLDVRKVEDLPGTRFFL